MIKYSDFKTKVDEAYVMDIQPLSSNPCSLGDCESGFSRYTFINGEVFEGVVTNGTLDVWGSYLYKDGSAYIGSWKDGRKHGPGIIYNEATSKFYDTYYQNDILKDHAAKGFALSEAEKRTINNHGIKNRLQ
ncbi:MAG: hypothetical protein IPG89_15315 [Bacteroidetes bacterium]|nr:hypothetical protein [Bacteroidota bacterium]